MATSRAAVSGAVLTAALAFSALAAPIPAHADDVAYLVNVTVRPGYGFANAQQALDYGHGLCDRLAAGQTYPDLIHIVKTDFNTSDEYQASYLISQSAQELCPAMIWQLRQSAAGYRPG